MLKGTQKRAVVDKHPRWCCSHLATKCIPLPSFFPSMKKLISYALPVVALFLAVAPASASDKVQIQASPDFRVAIVATEKPDAHRRAVQDAMAASLAASLSRQCNGNVNVKMIVTD